GRVCSAGSCGATCASPLRTCGAGSSAYCANTAIDPTNCNACGTVCALANVAANGCAAGACTVVGCAAGFGNCDGLAANGCETSTRTSPSSCGACGRACALPNATSTCTSGACAITACAAGFLDCDLSAANGCEVDARSDNANCGACSNACAAGRVCSAGSCGATCASPLRTCGAGSSAYCANTAVDPTNCNACGAVCALANVAAHGCAAGACTVLGCAAGYGNCDGLAANGCETNTRTSPSSCGACGRACALPNATSTCTSGACAITACAQGYANCDGDPANGCEVATGSDNANCGACGGACATGAVCSGGVCSTSCRAPQVNCSGVCTTLASDPSHCGACPTVCPGRANAAAYCTGGVCGFACLAGYGDCDGNAANGCETDLRSSLTSCGACGNRCALSNASASCLSGVCGVASCAVFFGNCDGNTANGCEVDMRSSNAHCGSCGRVCPGSQFCVNTGCECPAGSHPLGSACVPDSAVPRLLSPISLGDVTQRRPTLRWVLPAPYDGAEVALCVDRACSASFPGVGNALIVTGNTARPNVDLPAGATVFWRVRGRIGNQSDSMVSPVWLFHVPHRSASSGVDTSSHPHLDLNGDGYDDIAVGASRASPPQGSQAGAVAVFHGGPSGIVTTPVRVLEGSESNFNLGFSVASAGDVNGDGFGDLIVSEHRARTLAGSDFAGQVKVFHGGPTGIPPNPARVIQGSVYFGFFGYSVASAGDVNGDGYADVVVGSDGARTASVFHGSASGTLSTAAIVLTAGFLDDGYGRSVAGAGDVNGDGYSDIVVGAHEARPDGGFPVGTASVFHGGPSGITATAARVLAGSAPYARFGTSVAGAGDVNGDGYADLIVGPTNVGVFHGGASGIAATASSTLVGAPGDPQGQSSFGTAVSFAGDVNGDGYADVIVGAPNASPSGRSNAGTASVFHGGAGGVSTAAARVIEGVRDEYSAGAVARAGRTNGDSYDDVIIGTQNGNGGAGVASVFPGSPSGVERDPTRTMVGTGAYVYSFGTSVASADDVHGGPSVRRATAAWGLPPDDRLRWRTRSERTVPGGA
ncbi:MAG: FG-GAP-like repeat-containing protein, partial [Myxococcales bacterium]|nr:FG-GAP-like repeat-containing protein [Myxococcales bacterium]